MNRYARCQATTKSGNQCKSGAMHLTPFCGVHQGSPYPTQPTVPKKQQYLHIDFWSGDEILELIPGYHREPTQ